MPKPRLLSNLIEFGRNAASAAVSRTNQARIQFTSDGLQVSLSGGAYQTLVQLATNFIEALGIELVNQDAPTDSTKSHWISVADYPDGFGGSPQLAIGYNTADGGQTRIQAGKASVFFTVQSDYGASDAIFAGLYARDTSNTEIYPWFMQWDSVLERPVQQSFLGDTYLFKNGSGGLTIMQLTSDFIDLGVPTEFPSYSKAALPGNAVARVIWVSDDVGGPVLAYNDGAAWRRVSDGAVIS